MRMPWMKRLWLLLAAIALFGGSARAQNRGFTIERYEPTAAGEWTFWVDHPWYTKSKYFAAAGITLDYGHDPLVYGRRNGESFTETQSVIAHQLVGHLDLAGSFLDRALISASLPVVLLERGTPAGGAAPLSGASVGDIRIGAVVRVWKQPMRDPVSLHLGLDLWFPLGVTSKHAGDSSVRVLPKLIAAGLTRHIMWSASGGFLYRPAASIGAVPVEFGNTVGPEIQLGGALAYADMKHRFSIGPEAVLATVVTNGHAFKKDFTSLEVLAGAQYNAIKQIQIGLAVGLGLLREPGTPDVRVIARIAYAPFREDAPAPPRDRDHDGIIDVSDACPDEPGVGSRIAVLHGCPPPRDRDHDGIIDGNDVCPEVAQGAHADPQRLGCPDQDTDGDGVYDRADLCPAIAAGPHPDANQPGCPDIDTDGDSVFDSEDLCSDEAAGLHPDPARRGCPLADRDGDQVPDAIDACPDEPGAPDPQPKKNGCRGLVQIKDGKLMIIEPVFFETSKDVIVPKSFAVLQAVANALTAQAELEHIAIEGHTDNRGQPARNLDLSTRRARSVMRWLIAHDIAGSRLTSQGYGQSKPIASNNSNEGRAANRRVEFRIVAAAPTVAPAGR